MKFENINTIIAYIPTHLLFYVKMLYYLDLNLYMNHIQHIEHWTTNKLKEY